MERRKINGLEPERLALRNIVQVAAGLFHSFAIDSSGTVWAWGLNTFHQTGLTAARGGDEEMVMIPAQVDELSPDRHGGARVVQISGGEHHSLFLFDNGELWSCGRTDTYQTGIGLDHPAMLAIEGRRREEKEALMEKVNQAKAKLEEITRKGNDEEARRQAENDVHIAEARLSSPSNDYVLEPVRVSKMSRMRRDRSEIEDLLLTPARFASLPSLSNTPSSLLSLPMPIPNPATIPLHKSRREHDTTLPSPSLVISTLGVLAVSQRSPHLQSLSCYSSCPLEAQHKTRAKYIVTETCQLGLGKEEQAQVPTLVRSKVSSSKPPRVYSS